MRFSFVGAGFSWGWVYLEYDVLIVALLVAVMVALKVA